VDPQEIHFHEVGALDAVVDVAGVCYALSLLDPDQIVVSPVHVGSGRVRCAHGMVPVPAPATAALLEGVPCYGGEIKGELCTPTGAALLTSFADGFGPMPPMVLRATGYGIGKKDFPAANCVRAFWGETQSRGNGEILELVCSIDDMPAEALSFACNRLPTEFGALDYSITPVQMKKNRPGHILTVLCSLKQEEALARYIMEQTTTNGLRVRRCGKYYLNPAIRSVDTIYGTVRIKCASGYGVTHRKPEYDDVARIAQEQNLPFQTVWETITAQIQNLEI
jgi:uncharacterized protein (TIGR00299 family) protein